MRPGASPLPAAVTLAETPVCPEVAGREAQAAACAGDLPRAARGASRAPARASRRARAGGARRAGRSAIVAGLACSCFRGPAASAAASHAGAELGDVLLP